MSIQFFVPGRPAPGGSKKVFPIKKNGVPTGKFVVTDAAGQANKDWRANVVQAAFNAMKEANAAPLESAVKLELRFRMPRPKNHFRSNGELKPNAPIFHTVRPDVGKLARGTTDALTGIAFRDDAQVADDHHTKAYAQMPGCEVTISELT